MVRQGIGSLVLTNQGLSFVSQEKSCRILLSHIMSFQTGAKGLKSGLEDYGFALETDYARNNTHWFNRLNPAYVLFIQAVLELLANGTASAAPIPPFATNQHATLPPGTIVHVLWYSDHADTSPHGLA
jgi:hypothetical protein